MDGSIRVVIQEAVAPLTQLYNLLLAAKNMIEMYSAYCSFVLNTG